MVTRHKDNARRMALRKRSRGGFVVTTVSVKRNLQGAH